MNFFMIVGPQAVGKMTVGQHIAKLTGAKLFYNHMTIDLVSEFFDYGTQQGSELVNEYRRLLFEKVISASAFPGFIFTYVCDFDSPDGLKNIYTICNDFKDAGHNVYIIELNADYETRKERNLTDNRLRYKKLKRDIQKSEAIFERFEKGLRTTSKENELVWENYLRINNSFMSPDEVAKMVLNHFQIEYKN